MTSPYLQRPLHSLREALDGLDAHDNSRNKSMTPAQYARFRFARDERERVTGNREVRSKKDKTT